LDKASPQPLRHTATFDNHIIENRGKTLYQPKAFFMVP
jgi:hypothetical protein